MSECIFCGGECTCSTGAPAKKKKSAASKPVRKGLAPVLKVGVSQAPPAVLKKPEHAVLSTELTEEDIDYRSCMRALAPLLCEEDLGNIAHILNSAPSEEEQIHTFVKERTVEKERINEAWRARSTAE